jgi:hypothetical protein
MSCINCLATLLIQGPLVGHESLRDRLIIARHWYIAHCVAHRLTTLLYCKLLKYGEIIYERYMAGI